MRRSFFRTISFLLLINVFCSAGCKKDDIVPLPPDTGSVTDIEGNIYKTVRIGTQVWMAENLKVTKFRNGEDIPFVTITQDWADLLLPQRLAYCNSNNNTGTVAALGRLYNWHAVNDSRGLAPAGWHLPSLDEWLILMNNLGGKPVAGGKMKDTNSLYWPYQNLDASNSSGFTGRYTQRREYNGVFRIPNPTFENYTYWWSSTAIELTGPTPKASYAFLNSKGAPAYTNADSPNLGLAVRCVKD